MHLPRDRAADASLWPFDIASLAGNQMKVAVKNRLASGLPTVPTKIEPRHLWLALSDLVGEEPRQFMAVFQLLLSEPEKIIDVPGRYDEAMPICDGVFIPDCENGVIRLNYSLLDARFAELASRDLVWSWGSKIC